MPVAKVPNHVRTTSVKIRAIPGDGSCLFASIALGYHRSVGNADRLPNVVLKYLAQFYRDVAVAAVCERGSAVADGYRAFMTASQRRSYCWKMRLPTTYGGELEIAILSAALRIPIAVYERDPSSSRYALTSSYGPKFGKRPILLLYSRASRHYDVLLDRRR